MELFCNAAALKQVPAAEYNPEIYKNKYYWSEKYIKASIYNNVKKAIAVH